MLKRSFFFIISICLFGSLLLSFLCTQDLYAKSKKASDHYNILVISSFNYSNPTVSEQIDGISEGLSDVSCDISYEFMDAARFYNAADTKEFFDYMDYKLNGKNAHGYDLIMLCDDNALRFWTNFQRRLFPDVPAVFVGVDNKDDAEIARKRGKCTGVLEVQNYSKCIDLIRDLFPKKDEIVAIVDSSVTGRAEYVNYSNFAEEYKKKHPHSDLKFSTIITEDYSQAGLATAIGKIKENAAILYLDFSRDGDGTVYTPRTASLMISKNAPDIPVFRVSSANFGYGVLGGIVYSYKDAGKQAGRMAARVLEGEDPSKIDVSAQVLDSTIFDQKVMDEFNVSEAELPENTVILNPHKNLINLYKKNLLLSNIILLIIFMLIVIMGILFFTNYQREQLINQDFLTKMPNRLYINARVQQAMDSRKPFGILMMDVDHFKSINDTKGHPVGDELLISVSDRLRALSTRDLIFARIGGDEFMALVLGRNLQDKEPEKILKRLVAEITRPHELSCGQLNITASIGLAMYPKDSDDPTKIQSYADAALYEVKERGRNGYMIFRPSLVKHIDKLK